MRTWIGAALVFLLASCGSNNPPSGQELCKSVQRTTCDKVFDCAEAQAVRADYGGSKAACYPLLEAECIDSASGCEPGMTYHADIASQCASAVSAVTCAQLAAGDDPLYPAVCVSVCTTP